MACNRTREIDDALVRLAKEAGALIDFEPGNHGTRRRVRFTVNGRSRFDTLSGSPSDIGACYKIVAQARRTLRSLGAPLTSRSRRKIAPGPTKNQARSPYPCAEGTWAATGADGSMVITGQSGDDTMRTLSERRAAEREEKLARANTKAPHAPDMVLEPVSAAKSETGEDELYLVIDGERMAYRGHPGTADAGKWVSIHPERCIVHNDDNWNDGLPPDTPVRDTGEVQLFPEPAGRAQ